MDKDFSGRSSYSFSDIVEIIKRLRAEGGCPWDRAQTHKSLRGNLIEEAYELCEAIELDDTAKMLEESGDVLLQSVFHAVMAEEEGRFSVDGMLSALAYKLISRHTHVFGENKAGNERDALYYWDKAKSKEKGQTGVMDKINDIPATFSALMKANKAQKIIKKTGFDFANPEGALDKLQEEISEFKAARNGAEREKEAGDILFAAVNVLRMYDIDPEVALNGTTAKFIKRFEYVVKKAAEAGGKPEDFDVNTMEKWYQEYKKEYENR